MKNSNSPKVTIITVCYNVADNLEKTIKSVSNQTFKDFEYIVIDGGSKDNTIDIIKMYQHIITKWVSEPDHGIYDAMNKGIDKSEGEWVNFMNAGDTFVNNSVLESLFKGRIYPQASVIYGDAVLVFPNIGKVDRSYENIRTEAVPLNINHQSSFIKGDVIRRIKYDTSYKIASDGNTFLKIYNEGGSFKYIKMPIAAFETVGGISAKQLVRRKKEYMRIRNVKQGSILWYKSLLIPYLKTFLWKVLPAEYLQRRQYKHICKLYNKNDK